MPSSPNPSLIIKVFMRARVCDINRIDIITLTVSVSLCGSPYLFKLLSELPYVLLKLNNGPMHLMDVLSRNAHRVRSISLINHVWQ